MRRTHSPAGAAPRRDDALASESAHETELRVVYLRNFLSPDALAICQEWTRRIPSLTVLVSVAMEKNRRWNPTASGVDVQVQNTWTLARQQKHPDGYRDVNYVHLPRDTIGTLRRLSPEVVVSTELGMRSIMAAIYCRSTGWFKPHRRRCRLVLSVSTTPWIERSRPGKLRRMQRRRLLACADRVTYHGPECHDWLRSMGVPVSKLMPFDYSADLRNIYRGPIVDPPDTETTPAVSADGEAITTADRIDHQDVAGQVTLLTVGQLIDRKGCREALRDLTEVARRHPGWVIRWTLLGDGPLMESLRTVPRPDNLHLDLRGHVGHEKLRDAYRDHEVLWFPTRGDEWGLVVDEAMHSGLVVIGNPLAQASVTLIREGVNGFLVEVDDVGSLERALAKLIHLPPVQRRAMRQAARDSVRHRTPARSADQICRVIRDVYERSINRRDASRPEEFAEQPFDRGERAAGPSV